MKDRITDNAHNTARRIQENVSNLPITSMALAGLLGAGAVALFSSMSRRQF